MVLLLDITCNLHINRSYLSYWGGGKFDDYLQLRVTEGHDCPNLVLSRPQLSPIGSPAPYGNTLVDTIILRTVSNRSTCVTLDRTVIYYTKY